MGAPISSRSVFELIPESRLYLSACYDSGVRIFSGANADAPLATLNDHDLSVLSTCWLPSSSPSTSVLASGGMDRVVRIWSLPSAILDPTPDEAPTSHGQTTHLLPLHSAPVSTVRACPSSSKLLTGSWDGLVALWDLSDPLGDRIVSSTDDVEPVEVDVDAAPKKRRRKGPSATLASGAVKKVPKTTLRGHSGTVARALFSASQPHQKAVSASHDHTVRGWDLETGTEEWRKEGGAERCILDLDNCGREAVVTGTMDRTVCFWDARECAYPSISARTWSLISAAASTHVSLTMYGHRAPVSSVSSSPTVPSSAANPLVLSGSYDGTLKVWDLRSPKSSLFTLQRPAVEGKGSKVMCVGWSADGTLVGSGGEDGKLVLARGNPVGGGV